MKKTVPRHFLSIIPEVYFQHLSHSSLTTCYDMCIYDTCQVFGIQYCAFKIDMFYSCVATRYFATLSPDYLVNLNLFSIRTL